MNIKIKIKPRIYEASTKSELNRKMLDKHYYTSSSLFGTGYTSIYNASGGVRVFNIQKINRKIKRLNKFYQNDHGHVRISKKVSDTKWVGYVYDIPRDIFSIANIKVEQYNRNFKIISK